MTEYDITIKIEFTKSYRVDAENIVDAQTQALELAIKEYPNTDVWVE